MTDLARPEGAEPSTTTPLTRETVSAPPKEREDARVILTLTDDDAVALYDLVARSPANNGLWRVYADLGDAVRDENGHVPTHIDYSGPATRGGTPLAVSVSPPGTPTTAGSEPRTEREDSREGQMFAAFQKRVAEQRAANPHWRLGQTYFNVLYFDGFEPEFANTLRGTDLDPFHREHAIPAFLDAVRAQFARIEAFDAEFVPDCDTEGS